MLARDLVITALECITLDSKLILLPDWVDMAAHLGSIRGVAANRSASATADDVAHLSLQLANSVVQCAVCVLQCHPRWPRYPLPVSSWGLG